ncbi:MAG: hypothetical protein ACFFG0_26320, partial [Candidatus Thorarchaeota archaeon]
MRKGKVISQKTHLVNLLKNAFSKPSIRDLSIYLGFGANDLKSMALKGDKHFEIDQLYRFKFFLENSPDAVGDLSDPNSARSKALQYLDDYEFYAYNYFNPVNLLELELIYELRTLYSLQMLENTGTLRYIGKNELMMRLGLESDYTRNIFRELDMSKRSFTKAELYIIRRSIANQLTGKLYERAFDAFYHYEENHEPRGTGYHEDWNKIRIEQLVELYILQCGLDGDTGEPIPLTTFLRRHHINYDKSSIDLFNIILLTRTSHNNIDHNYNLDDFSRLRVARNSFEDGVAPPHWDQKYQDDYYDRKQRLELEGEEFLLGGYTKSEIIALFKIGFIGANF